jgi:hypothetical protein
MTVGPVSGTDFRQMVRNISPENTFAAHFQRRASDISNCAGPNFIKFDSANPNKRIGEQAFAQALNHPVLCAKGVFS